ncbi:glypican-1 [Spea bombifrons]|uniref:glypican-1 n=1 Tax=Spea bombifrons TaxID=233779 RepID=UPI00234A9491|nr:glypican-1 [Spea bombifrons]
MEKLCWNWWWTFGVVLLLHWAAGDTGSKAKSCSEVKQVYSSKGFGLSGVPQSEISGEHLRICPQGYTCCTSEMEENFANTSKLELEARLKESSLSIQGLFVAQHRTFDLYFQNLLNKSEQILQETFPNMYGDLYNKNERRFKDLYTELRRYYRGSGISLEESLHDFWSHLLEILFKAQNVQVSFTEEPEDCLKLFGDIPREMKLKVTRAFIAARSFVQGLSAAADIVRKVSQVPMSQECTRALLKLQYCPHCRGLSSTKPCVNYCWNVICGCLANQADLDSEWKNLIDSLMLVADKFRGASNVVNIMGSIHIKISEAITYMQKNQDDVADQVLASCGVKNRKGLKADEIKRKVKVPQEDKTAVVSAENLVSEVKVMLNDIQDFWVSLPNIFCNEKVTAGPTNEDKCWNGNTKGRYMPERMGSGLANQINNPEVDVDITKPDVNIRQHIMQLKIMTNRLRNAYNGNDVDFQDASDDASGSGSGDGCSDDTCEKKTYRDSTMVQQPPIHVIPNKQGNDVSGKGSILYSWDFLLLLLALLVARW